MQICSTNSGMRPKEAAEFLLENGYFLTALELWIESQAAGRESEVHELKAFFSDPSRFPPEELAKHQDTNARGLQALARDREQLAEKLQRKLDISEERLAHALQVSPQAALPEIKPSLEHVDGGGRDGGDGTARLIHPTGSPGNCSGNPLQGETALSVSSNSRSESKDPFPPLFPAERHSRAGSNGTGAADGGGGGAGPGRDLSIRSQSGSRQGAFRPDPEEARVLLEAVMEFLLHLQLKMTALTLAEEADGGGRRPLSLTRTAIREGETPQLATWFRAATSLERIQAAAGSEATMAALVADPRGARALGGDVDLDLQASPGLRSNSAHVSSDQSTDQSACPGVLALFEGLSALETSLVASAPLPTTGDQNSNPRHLNPNFSFSKTIHLLAVPSTGVLSDPGQGSFSRDNPFLHLEAASSEPGSQASNGVLDFHIPHTPLLGSQPGESGYKGPALDTKRSRTSNGDPLTSQVAPGGAVDEELASLRRRVTELEAILAQQTALESEEKARGERTREDFLESRSGWLSGIGKLTSVGSDAGRISTGAMRRGSHRKTLSHGGGCPVPYGLSDVSMEGVASPTALSTPQDSSAKGNGKAPRHDLPYRHPSLSGDALQQISSHTRRPTGLPPLSAPSLPYSGGSNGGGASAVLPLETRGRGPAASNLLVSAARAAADDTSRAFSFVGPLVVGARLLGPDLAAICSDHGGVSLAMLTQPDAWVCVPSARFETLENVLRQLLTLLPQVAANLTVKLRFSLLDLVTAAAAAVVAAEIPVPARAKPSSEVAEAAAGASDVGLIAKEEAEDEKALRSLQKQELLDLVLNITQSPSASQRQAIETCCLRLVELFGPRWTLEKLLPQCWRQCNALSQERRLLVSELLGLAPVRAAAALNCAAASLCGAARKLSRESLGQSGSELPGEGTNVAREKMALPRRRGLPGASRCGSQFGGKGVVLTHGGGSGGDVEDLAAIARVLTPLAAGSRLGVNPIADEACQLFLSLMNENLTAAGSGFYTTSGSSSVLQHPSHAQWPHSHSPVVFGSGPGAGAGSLSIGRTLLLHLQRLAEDRSWQVQAASLRSLTQLLRGNVVPFSPPAYATLETVLLDLVDSVDFDSIWIHMSGKEYGTRESGNVAFGSKVLAPAPDPSSAKQAERRCSAAGSSLLDFGFDNKVKTKGEGERHGAGAAGMTNSAELDDVFNIFGDDTLGCGPEIGGIGSGHAPAADGLTTAYQDYVTAFLTWVAGSPDPALIAVSLVSKVLGAIRAKVTLIAGSPRPPEKAAALPGSSRDGQAPSSSLPPKANVVAIHRQPPSTSAGAAKSSTGEEESGHLALQSQFVGSVLSYSLAPSGAASKNDDGGAKGLFPLASREQPMAADGGAAATTAPTATEGGRGVTSQVTTPESLDDGTKSGGDKAAGPLTAGVGLSNYKIQCGSSTGSTPDSGARVEEGKLQESGKQDLKNVLSASSVSTVLTPTSSRQPLAGPEPGSGEKVKALSVPLNYTTLSRTESSGSSPGPSNAIQEPGFASASALGVAGAVGQAETKSVGNKAADGGLASEIKSVAAAPAAASISAPSSSTVTAPQPSSARQQHPLPASNAASTSKDALSSTKEVRMVRSLVQLYTVLLSYLKDFAMATCPDEVLERTLAAAGLEDSGSSVSGLDPDQTGGSTVTTPPIFLRTMTSNRYLRTSGLTSSNSPAAAARRKTKRRGAENTPRRRKGTDTALDVLSEGSMEGRSGADEVSGASPSSLRDPHPLASRSAAISSTPPPPPPMDSLASCPTSPVDAQILVQVADEEQAGHQKRAGEEKRASGEESERQRIDKEVTLTQGVGELPPQGGDEPLAGTATTEGERSFDATANAREPSKSLGDRCLLNKSNVKKPVLVSLSVKADGETAQVSILVASEEADEASRSSRLKERLAGDLLEGVVASPTTRTCRDDDGTMRNGAPRPVKAAASDRSGIEEGEEKCVCDDVAAGDSLKRDRGCADKGEEEEEEEEEEPPRKSKAGEGSLPLLLLLNGARDEGSDSVEPTEGRTTTTSADGSVAAVQQQTPTSGAAVEEEEKEDNAAGSVQGQGGEDMEVSKDIGLDLDLDLLTYSPHTPPPVPATIGASLCSPDADDSEEKEETMDDHSLAASRSSSSSSTTADAASGAAAETLIDSLAKTAGAATSGVDLSADENEEEEENEDESENFYVDDEAARVWRAPPAIAFLVWSCCDAASLPVTNSDDNHDDDGSARRGVICSGSLEDVLRLPVSQHSGAPGSSATAWPALQWTVQTLVPDLIECARVASVAGGDGAAVKRLTSTAVAETCKAFGRPFTRRVLLPLFGVAAGLVPAPEAPETANSFPAPKTSSTKQTVLKLPHRIWTLARDTLPAPPRHPALRQFSTLGAAAPSFFGKDSDSGSHPLCAMYDVNRIDEEVLASILAAVGARRRARATLLPIILGAVISSADPDLDSAVARPSAANLGELAAVADGDGKCTTQGVLDLDLDGDANFSASEVISELVLGSLSVEVTEAADAMMLTSQLLAAQRGAGAAPPGAGRGAGLARQHQGGDTTETTSVASLNKLHSTSCWILDCIHQDMASATAFSCETHPAVSAAHIRLLEALLRRCCGDPGNANATAVCLLTVATARGLAAAATEDQAVRRLLPALMAAVNWQRGRTAALTTCVDALCDTVVLGKRFGESAKVVQLVCMVYDNLLEDLALPSAPPSAAAPLFPPPALSSNHQVAIQISVLKAGIKMLQAALGGVYVRLNPAVPLPPVLVQKVDWILSTSYTLAGQLAAQVTGMAAYSNAVFSALEAETSEVNAAFISGSGSAMGTQSTLDGAPLSASPLRDAALASAAVAAPTCKLSKALLDEQEREAVFVRQAVSQQRALASQLAAAAILAGTNPLLEPRLAMLKRLPAGASLRGTADGPNYHLLDGFMSPGSGSGCGSETNPMGEGGHPGGSGSRPESASELAQILGHIVALAEVLQYCCKVYQQQFQRRSVFLHRQQLETQTRRQLRADTDVGDAAEDGGAALSKPPAAAMTAAAAAAWGGGRLLSDVQIAGLSALLAKYGDADVTLAKSRSNGSYSYLGQAPVIAAQSPPSVSSHLGGAFCPTPTAKLGSGLGSAPVGQAPVSSGPSAAVPPASEHDGSGEGLTAAKRGTTSSVGAANLGQKSLGTNELLDPSAQGTMMRKEREGVAAPEASKPLSSRSSESGLGSITVDPAQKASALSSPSVVIHRRTVSSAPEENLPLAPSTLAAVPKSLALFSLKTTTTGDVPVAAAAQAQAGSSGGGFWSFGSGQNPSATAAEHPMVADHSAPAAGGEAAASSSDTSVMSRLEMLRQKFRKKDTLPTTPPVSTNGMGTPTQTGAAAAVTPSKGLSFAAFGGNTGASAAPYANSPSSSFFNFGSSTASSNTTAGATASGSSHLLPASGSGSTSTFKSFLANLSTTSNERPGVGPISGSSSVSGSPHVPAADQATTTQKTDSGTSHVHPSGSSTFISPCVDPSNANGPVVDPSNPEPAPRGPEPSLFRTSADAARRPVPPPAAHGGASAFFADSDDDDDDDTS